MTFLPNNGPIFGMYGLDPKQMQRAALSQGLMNAGALMLGQGATPYPQGFGSSIGRGLLGFTQGMQQGQEQAMQQYAMNAEMERLQWEREKQQAEADALAQSRVFAWDDCLVVLVGDREAITTQLAAAGFPAPIEVDAEGRPVGP